MVSEGVSNTMLVLRIIALAASVATIVLIVTNKVKYGHVFFHHIDLKFQVVMGFRYVLAVAAISAAYGIIQLPFAVYYALKHKRLISNGCLPDFDFIADKVISLVLATAVGAGIGLSYEYKRRLEQEQNSGVPINIYDTISKRIKFYDRGIIASSVLALACLCMAFVSVISSIHRSQSKGALSN